MLPFMVLSQSAIKGKIVDAENGEPLVGASVLVKGTVDGTVTNLDGSFSFKTKKDGKSELVISYIGYLTKEMPIELKGSEIDLYEIKLDINAVGISEVRVMADVALDRTTPVAVSTIEPQLIERKLGTQEFPEILKSTPGIYATKQGGGWGDARVNIRGFDSRNVAVMINGVPVNDMEGGKVYWSNWAGLSDVTRSMQVQRGLGASKVAVPSIGGTINVLTKTTDAEKGGNVGYTVGNDGYEKMSAMLSTGLTDNDWAATLMFSKTTGKGTFVDGTYFEGYNYFMNLSKRLNDKHNLSFTVFGAPQKHGQRTSELSIKEVEESDRGIKYNQDWGYKNGQLLSVRENFYHKPMAVLNHFWDINENSSLSTAFYASIGTGGGTGDYQRYDIDTVTNKFYDDNYVKEGTIDFDRIVDENIESSENGMGSTNILRASVNNHHWYGVLSTYKKELGSINLTAGVDGRYYYGEHYREVTDLMGGDHFLDVGTDVNNYNNAVKVGDKIGYHNDGEVLWEGLFVQAEFNEGNLAAYVSASVSNKSYRRYDYFNYFNDDTKDLIDSDETIRQEYIDQFGGSADQNQQDFDNSYYNDQISDWQHYLGYTLKGGVTLSLTDQHIVFANAGYIQRQPDFNTAFLSYTNTINDDAENEKVISGELGYRYRSRFFSANVNAYYTQWLDKSFLKSFPIIDEIDDPDAPGGVRYVENTYTANVLGVNAQHMGIEVDFNAKVTDRLNITGMVSVADWIWMDNVEDVEIFDEQQNLVGTSAALYLEDTHVGDAAQTTAAIGLNYEIVKNFNISADYNYYDRLYAYYDPNYRTSLDANGEVIDAWELPTYGILDFGMYYKFKVGDFDARFIANMYNVLDTEYISEATDGADHNWQTARVYYGFGRTWSMGLRLNF